MSGASDLMVQTPGGGGDGGRRSGHVVKLRRRELNPGLPRDRRKYSPLYYSGDVKVNMEIPKTNLELRLK